MRGYGLGLLLFGAGFVGGCAQRIVEDEPSDFETVASTGEEDDDSSSGEPLPGTGGVQCFEPQDCPENATCFEGVCVGTGELRISLSWDYVSDLDLHVETPTGAHISFEDPAVGGGVLDVDDCIGGECLDNAATHVENIYFPQQPPLGEYRVWVYNFDGKAGGPFEIEISGEVSMKFRGDLPASPVQSEYFTFDL